MNDQNDFCHHQLVLATKFPNWGYGRIIEINRSSDRPQYRVYFYHSDQYEMLSSEEIQKVPDNYQPPFAPDPRHFFGDNDS
jgi:hypothetical protein